MTPPYWDEKTRRDKGDVLLWLVIVAQGYLACVLRVGN